MFCKKPITKNFVKLKSKHVTDVVSRWPLLLLFALDAPWYECITYVTFADFKDGSCLLFINVINGTAELILHLLQNRI